MTSHTRAVLWAVKESIIRKKCQCLCTVQNFLPELELYLITMLPYSVFQVI